MSMTELMMMQEAQEHHEKSKALMLALRDWRDATPGTVGSARANANLRQAYDDMQAWFKNIKQEPKP